MAQSFKNPFPSQLFENYSKQECQHALQVFHYAAQAETSEDVRDVLIQFQELFPFNRLLGGLARLSSNGTFEGFSNVVNVSYPDEWLYLYWKNGYAEIDPVFRAASRSPGTQIWKQTYRQTTSKEELEFIETARGFGLADGITTSAVDQACGLATFYSFAGGEGVDAERYAPLVEYFGHHLHLALMRTARKNAPATDKCVKELSPREVTILNWIKNGKTNWEVGQILGVTERTVRFHIASIFVKLDVTSRSQAVAAAMEHGLPTLHGLPSVI
jgi:DNA-binding CsgD family transcriptional regulator